PPGVHHDARREACRAQGRCMLSRVRQAPEGRKGLWHRAAAVSAPSLGRNRHAPPQPRARGADTRMPGTVPVELQPVQGSERGARPVSRVVFVFMYLVQFLPLAAIAAIGNGVGAIAFWLIPERRNVTRTNLGKCFPTLDEAAREKLARAHFR